MALIKGIHLDGKKEMSVVNGVENYLNPKFVYFPLTNGTLVYKALVNAGDVVLKGQAILERVDRFAHPIKSSVSGTVKGIKKMWHPVGRMVDMLEIENDFLEKTVDSWGKPLEDLSKEGIIERVKEAGIVGLGGAGFPTYAKYTNQNEMEYFIVNAAECEPFISCDYTLMVNDAEKLIKGIEYAMTACGAKKAIIAIKKNKVAAVEALSEVLADKEYISLFPLNDEYPAGWERYLVSKVLKRKYKTLPSEVGVVINNVQTCIAICNAVEHNIPLVEKMMTFTGEGLNHPCNVNVKIGSLMSDVIESIGGYTADLTPNSYFVVGGPMSGTSIMFDNVVICGNTNACIVRNKNEGPSNNCMGCGKCAASCPAHLTPTEIKRVAEAGDNEALEALNVNACVQCGLCSYVCPSRCEITEAMGKAKQQYAKYLAMKKAKEAAKAAKTVNLEK